ncbi:hypothetical protein KUTeg_019879 [Tegillarca granosa]|uniref:C-type lectin domain-containing protein n=1 Tax=Tegillarca granosa TaxID=220873 RepID=A0ABQ9EDU7_TEGGR|nr:hypothetical protein KUTeg_019879 [Tegillarca granosa]
MENFVTAQCPSGWVQHESLCYFFSHDAATWEEAAGTCKAFNTKLAEPETYSAAHFITGKAQEKHQPFWIGVTDMMVDDEWIYPSDLRQILITNWGPGEPNQHTGANCVTTWVPHNSRWADEPCQQRYRFICEKST